MVLPPQPRHDFPISPTEGWWPLHRRHELNLSAEQLRDALDIQGEVIGWLMHQLAAEVATQQLANEPAALVQRAQQLQGGWRKPPKRFRVSGHAMSRFAERVRPDLPERKVWQEMQCLAAEAPFSLTPPSWLRLGQRLRARSGYLLVSDEVCFAVSDGVIRTVLTETLADEFADREDPYAERGDSMASQMEDPLWPQRRYIAVETGEIECRTIFEGTLLRVRARSSYLAFLALRERFEAMGLAARFRADCLQHRLRQQDALEANKPALQASA